jgi:DNA repair protein RecO (recombination protein O)
MAIEKSEAVVLKAYNWSESSRTVVVFTERFGKLALIDKGGRRLSSKRGRLLPFARLEIAFYASERETGRDYISEVSLLRAFSFESDGTLGRLAYASAACELLHLLLAEHEAQPDLFQHFVAFLEHMETARRRFLPAVFLEFLLRLMSRLGYHPSLAACIGCGVSSDRAAADGQTIRLSCERGGIVCAACEKPGDYYIHVSLESLRILTALQKASLGEAATLPIGYAEASQLLDAMVKLLGYQAGISSELKSLEFLQKLKNSQTTG